MVDYSKSSDLRITVTLNPTYMKGGTTIIEFFNDIALTTIKLSEEQLLDLTCAIRKEAERRVPRFVRKQ